MLLLGGFLSQFVQSEFWKQAREYHSTRVESRLVELDIDVVVPSQGFKRWHMRLGSQGLQGSW
jgi:hypothetical protein